jgi:predicted methyltransferase
MNRTSTLLLAIFLGACGQHADEQHTSEHATNTTEPMTEVAEPMTDVAEPMTEAAEPTISIYAAAIANDARPDTDRARDAARKPAEVLEFFGIEPGMTVLDLFSGGGYYTELIAHVVGPEGRVHAHTNDAYIAYVSDEFEQRYLDGRLANAEVLMAENNELSLEPGTYDAVMLVLTFHDFSVADAENGWPEIDVPALLAELNEGLKPGGIVGVVDHYAAAGSGRETGSTTHRIDPAIVIEEMTAAGFVLEGESDALRNPADDYEKNIFDGSVIGKTDRFVMRFRKPE